MKDDTLKTRVQYIHPPIPVRVFDWIAWIDGQEETGPYGYGTTENEARENLTSQCDYSHPCYDE